VQNSARTAAQKQNLLPSLVSARTAGLQPGVQSFVPSAVPRPVDLQTIYTLVINHPLLN
jgi:hypothetical protein